MKNIPLLISCNAPQIFTEITFYTYINSLNLIQHLKSIRTVQYFSHHCSELQASRVFPTVKVTGFPLFRISEMPMLYAYLISNQTWIFWSRCKVVNDQCEGTILAPRSMRVPRGRAELGRDTWALLLVRGDADSRFADFARETSTSLKKKEQVSKDLKVAG